MALAEPLEEGLGREGGKLAVAVDAGHFFDDDAVHRQAVGEVGDARHQRAEGAHEIGIPEDAVLEFHAVLARVDRLVAEHEAREVHRKLVRGDVGADGVTELALVAFIDHFLMHGQRQLLEGFSLTVDVVPGLCVMSAGGGRLVVAEGIELAVPAGGRGGDRRAGVERVDGIEQRREAGAQVEAEPASVADLEHALFFRDERVAAPIDVFPGAGYVSGHASLQIHKQGPKRSSEVGPERMPEGSGAQDGPLHHREEAERFDYRESRPFWKRPAWDFSALARVSNQLAISTKPSSRAEAAMPGYMSVYS